MPINEKQSSLLFCASIAWVLGGLGLSCCMFEPESLSECLLFFLMYKFLNKDFDSDSLFRLIYFWNLPSFIVRRYYQILDLDTHR